VAQASPSCANTKGEDYDRTGSKLESTREMSIVTSPLREEHKELLPHVEQLRTVADSVGETAFESLRHSLDEIDVFLTHHLLPHAQAEERALYPVVGKLMGVSQATATMSRDHIEIARLIEELESLRSRLLDKTPGTTDERDLRRVLYGLYAVVKLHFAKEEEIYLPLLDARLTDDEASRMFAAMEQVAQEARHPVS
jgi:iron-sulfur cluster repair protein YtfE (RIC family)